MVWRNQIPARLVLSTFFLWFLPNCMQWEKGGRAEDATPAVVKGNLMKLLAWVPPETESLMATNGLITVEELEPVEEPEKDDDTEYFPRLASELPPRTNEELTKEFMQLQRSSALYMFPRELQTNFHRRVVATLRTVQSPGRFEREGEAWLFLDQDDHFSVPSCQFLEYSDESATLLIDQLRREAKTEFERHGFQVVQLDNDFFCEDSWWVKGIVPSLYFAVPHPRVIVAATDPEYLDKLLLRVHDQKKTIEIEHLVAMSRLVDFNASTWGFRRYPKDSSRGSNSLLHLDEEAQWLGFCFQPSSDMNLKFFYASKSAKGIKEFEQGFHWLNFRTKRVAPLIHQFSHPLAQEGRLWSPVNTYLHLAGWFGAF